jgi:hypothetical protein
MPLPVMSSACVLLRHAIRPPYRLLELLEEKMCLLFLRTIRSRLHRIVGGQHRREDLLGSVGGHGG